MRQSGKRFHKPEENHSSQGKVSTAVGVKNVEKTEIGAFSKKQKVAEVSVGS